MSDLHDMIRTILKREKEKGFGKDVQALALHSIIDVLIEEVYEK